MSAKISTENITTEKLSGKSKKYTCSYSIRISLLMSISIYSHNVIYCNLSYVSMIKQN